MNKNKYFFFVAAMLFQVGMRAAAIPNVVMPNKRDIQILVNEQEQLLMQRMPKSRVSAAILTNKEMSDLLSSSLLDPKNADIAKEVRRLEELFAKAGPLAEIIPITLMCINNQPNISGTVKILENPALYFVDRTILSGRSGIFLELKIGEREVQMECQDLALGNHRPNGDCAHFKKTLGYDSDVYRIAAVINSEQPGDTLLLRTIIEIEGNRIEEISQEQIIPKYNGENPIEAMRLILYIAQSPKFSELNAVFPVLGTRLTLRDLLGDAIAQDPDAAYNLIIESTDREIMFTMGARNFFEALDTRHALQMVLSLLDRRMIQLLSNLNFERKTGKIYSDKIKTMVDEYFTVARTDADREHFIQSIRELTTTEINRLNNFPAIPAPRRR